MLLKMSTLEGIAAGEVELAFRRWRSPRVKAGSTFHSPIGLIAVRRVEPVALRSITRRDAQRAGYTTRAELLRELERHPDGQLYRISLTPAGADPRRALRNRSELDAAERAELVAKLDRLGARSADGPWAHRTLRLIRRRPAVRAAELASELGMDTARFKARVRQLKALGLTESLDVGYRLSPRGREVLRGRRA